MRFRISSIAGACLLAGCHQPTTSDAANVQATVSNGLSTAGNVAAAIVKPNDPGAVCNDPETKVTLRELISAQLASNAQNGLHWSSTVAQMIALAGLAKGQSAKLDLTFAGTTVDSVDVQTKKVTCTTSLVVEGEGSDAAHSRLSFSVQQPVDQGANIVALTNPLQVEAAGPALIAGIQHRIQVNADAEKRAAADQPEAAAEPAAQPQTDNAQ